MGGGKGGGCQTVGYGYSLTMLYAFCEKADIVSGWKVNDKVWWRDNPLLNSNNPYSTYTRSLYTGEKGKVYSSDYNDHTELTFYLQNYSPIPYPQNTIGYDIKLNNLAFVYMNNAFVGDNTTTVPRYEARLSRFWIRGNYEKVGEASVNPVAVILDILITYVKISLSAIDTDSFNEAKTTLQNEGIGISMLMTTEKDVVKWIKEILRVIDGALYFDTLSGKWKLKLFREDYDINNVFVLNEYNTSMLKITSGGLDNLVSSFTFKYSNYLTGKTESFTIENSAIFNILGYKVHKNYTFQLICEHNIMYKVASRIIKKHAKPLHSFKARISILDIPYINLGDIIAIESETLDIPTRLFRITKIGADKEDDVYVDIEGVEELWAKDIDFAVTTSPPNTTANVPNISDLIPYKVIVKELPSIFFKDDKQPLAFIVTAPENYENTMVIQGARSKEVYSNFQNNDEFFRFGKLNTTIPITEEWKLNTFTIDVIDDNGKTCDLPIIDNSEEEWQKLKYIMLINDELFAVRKIEKINNNLHKITGIIRLSEKQEHHNTGNLVYIKPVQNINNILSYYTSLNKAKIVSKLFNLYTESQEKESSEISITKKAFKPLSPGNPIYFTTNSNKFVKFRNRSRGDLSEAIYKDTDLITAGNKENNIEIEKIILSDGSNTYIYNVNDSKVTYENGVFKIDVSDITNPITKISVIINGYESDEISVLNTGNYDLYLNQYYN